MFLLSDNIPANLPYYGEEGMHWVIKYMLVGAIIVIPIVFMAFWKLAKKLDNGNISEEQWED